MNYNRFGILIDCSANGVMKVEQVKHLIDLMKTMGYNLLELGMDDVYKIDGEPYFGYLRGGYTQAELKELDDYAFERGIELVPCVQTLAHLTNLVKLPHYADIVDVDNILLIDEPKTYELIEKMFQTIRKCFRTNCANIGMDEAHMVGLGKYLDKHGHQNRFDLLLKHLGKVVDIAEKYGFKVHMWSDMFFRLNNHGDYYVKGSNVPQEVLDKVPDNVDICYWDYGEHELTEEMFDELFRQHEAFGKDIWFAGGAWCWNGFAPFNRYSLAAMKCALKQAANHSVRNVFITLWGVDSNDCSYFSTLPTLYALRQYADGIYDEETIKKGFYDTFGLSFDDFMLADLPNVTSRDPLGLLRENPCKALLYNDCFLGWKDYPLERVDKIPYGDYAKRLETVANKMGEFKYIFDNLAALCRVLEFKAYLGIRTRKAYQAKDKKELRRLLEDYAVAADRVEEFRKTMRKMWMKEYKPYGWEVQQIRLGGLRSRILDCRLRIVEYLEGQADSIPELEEEILPYADWGLQYNLYRGLVSVSEL